MWISSKLGFAALAVNMMDEDTYVIRTRTKVDAEKAVEITGGELVQTWESDYPYRVVVDDKGLIKYMLEASLTIDYTKYKETMDKDSQLYRSHVAAWWAFLDLDDRPEEAKFGARRPEVANG